MFISGEVLILPIPAITRDVGDYGDLGRPSPLPYPSQIGVGLEVLEVLEVPITAITCDVGGPGDLGPPLPLPGQRQEYT
jgi:hypothetical protein